MTEGEAGAGATGPAWGAALPPSGFEERLLALNGLAAGGFGGWMLLPGMGFGDPDSWWRPGERRKVPHEGLDLRGYRDATGGRHSLGAGAAVPAPWGGEVAAVRPDYLGVSVFVAHGRPGAGPRLHSACGHLAPAAGIEAGARVAAGDVLGVLADPAERGRSVPAHLHLTLALVPGGLPAERLDWGLLAARREVRLLDPAALLTRICRG